MPSWIRGLGAAGDLSDQQLQVPPCRCPLLGSSPQEWLPAASRHPRASSSCFQIMREGPVSGGCGLLVFLPNPVFEELEVAQRARGA